MGAGPAIIEVGPFALRGKRVAVLQLTWHPEARDDGEPAGTAEPVTVLIVGPEGPTRVPLGGRPAVARALGSPDGTGLSRALVVAIGAAAWRRHGARVTVRAVRVDGGVLRPIGPALRVDPGEHGPGGCYNGAHDGPRGSAGGAA